MVSIESVDGHCNMERLGRLTRHGAIVGRSLWSWSGVGVMRIYSQCAEVGHAEVYPSVGFDHMVSSVGVPCRKRQMWTNVDGQVWIHLETSCK